MSLVAIGRGWSRESRTKTQTTGTFVETWYQERDVKLETKIEIGANASCPDISTIDPDPTETTGTATYDSRVQWDPVTTRYVKTDIVRVAETAWRNIRYTTSGEVPTYSAGG